MQPEPSPPPQPDSDDALVDGYLVRLEEDGLEAAEAFLRARNAGVEVVGRIERLRRHGLLEVLRVPATLPLSFGEFELRCVLGDGGMGVVYGARQPSLGREVAIKCVRPEFVTCADARQRFRREAEAIAALDHPGIVRILQVGEQRGQPYLAMERLPGPSVADVLRLLQGLAPAAVGREAAARLAEVPGAVVDRIAGRRWRDVCVDWTIEIAGALAHAHARGVVHRDVKPSNVLFAGDGRLVLVDFGLAHVAADPQLTRTGAWVGSPLYVAPELLASGARTEPRPSADVYALGVSLVEMLGLVHPLRDATPIDALRRSEHGVDLDRALHRLGLDRDLAILCRTAVAPEPARRYGDAAALRDDLLAVRDGRPITARPPTLPYRAIRWVARHRAASVALVLAFLLFVVAPVVSWVTIRAERDVARANELVYRQALGLVEGMLERADPAQNGGVAPSVRELLDVEHERVADAELDPGVRAELALMLGRVDLELGASHAAEQMFAVADQQLVAFGGDHGLRLAQAAIGVGRALALRQDQSAVRWLEEGARRLSQASPRPPDDGAAVAAALEIAIGYLDLRLWEYAMAAYARVLAAEGAPERCLLRARVDLANVHAMSLRFPLAREHLAAADAIAGRLRLEPDAPLGLRRDEVRGLLAMQTGDNEAAVEQLTRVFEVTRRLRGDARHPDVLRVQHLLSLALLRAGHAAAAVEHALAVDEAHGAASGDEGGNRDDAVIVLAQALEADGRFDEAEAAYRRYIAIGEQGSGRSVHYRAWAQRRLARFLAARGRFTEADDAFTLAAGQFEACADLPLRAKFAAQTRIEQAEALADAERADAAARLAREAMVVLRTRYLDHSDAPESYLRGFALLERLQAGLADERAAALAALPVAQRRENAGKLAGRGRRALLHGHLLRSAGDLAGAGEQLRQACRLLDEGLGPQHPSAQLAHRALESIRAENR